MPADIYAIAASGMSAQQTQMDLIASNLANVSTSRSATGGPYHPRSAILQTATSFDDVFALANLSDGFAGNDGVSDWSAPPGVEVAAIATETDKEVDSIGQMVALVAAGRGYDADVAVLQSAKQMDLEASDIARYA
ncbi:MAG: flagellar basal body protein [Candidatus Eremiobacteraeota bacterium]|nr:flagellar basal body protein [Candidatus Eremiobacteraeota bacterium]